MECRENADVVYGNAGDSSSQIGVGVLGQKILYSFMEQFIQQFVMKNTTIKIVPKE